MIFPASAICGYAREVSSGCQKLSPFYFLNLIISVLINNLVTNEWIVLKLIPNIYNYSVVMHVKFHKCVVRNRGVIAL